MNNPYISHDGGHTWQDSNQLPSHRLPADYKQHEYWMWPHLIQVDEYGRGWGYSEALMSERSNWEFLNIVIPAIRVWYAEDLAIIVDCDTLGDWQFTTQRIAHTVDRWGMLPVVWRVFNTVDYVLSDSIPVRYLRDGDE